MTVVDLHNHFFPERWPDWDAKFGGEPWPTITTVVPAWARSITASPAGLIRPKLASTCAPVVAPFSIPRPSAITSPSARLKSSTRFQPKLRQNSNRSAPAPP